MMRAVDDVLEEIGAGDRPAPARAQQGRRCSTPTRARTCACATPTACSSPALTGEGLEALGERIEARVRPLAARRRAAAALRATAAASPSCTSSPGDLEREDTPEGVRVRARVPATVAARFERYAVNGRPA